MQNQNPPIPNKKSIIELIASGDLESAIKQSLEFTKQKSSQDFKSITILSCRYYTFWRDTLQGITSIEEKERAINKIAIGLYDIIDKTSDTS